MQAFRKLTGIAAVLPVENIDTDQIIPAEHLKITNKSGLGKFLFSNWRYDKNDNEEKSFVLNQPATRHSQILITGKNFGCGSSREHAPWSLIDFGIKVVISSSIADIFRNNSIKNGLLPIVIGATEHEYLLQQNAQEIEVDIEEQVIKVQRKIIPFKLEEFARYCFLNGMDQLDFLLSHDAAIQNYEVRENKVL